MSECTHLSFDSIPQFSKRDRAYQTQTSIFSDFYKYSPEIASFAQVIADRSKINLDRDLLVDVLETQYDGITLSKTTSDNIQSLRSEHTFTVTTAHQLSILTGPLYYITKMVSSIRLSEELKKAYPSYHFVPVFVHGGEDHDYEEINHIHLFGKVLTWHTEQTGPVGRFSKDGLQEIITELNALLEREPHADYVSDIIEEAYANSKDYKGFVLRMVHSLFDQYGLVQLQMDHSDLKRAFIPILQKELLEQPSQEYVITQQEALAEIGYKGQAYPREINLFLLSEGSRDRLELIDGRYQVVGKQESYNEQEIINLLHTQPEKFSPNVIIRPMYQEYILPNLAYIGGGGELAYWLERKTQFEHFGVSYPILVRRDSVLVVDASTQKQIDKLGFTIEDLFKDLDTLIDTFIKAQSTEDISVDAYIHQSNEIFTQLATMAASADPSLKSYVLSEQTKHEKTLKQIEGRIKRAYKSKEEVNINKIGKIKEKLFPNNGMQERYENNFPFLAKYGHFYIDTLMDHLDPMDRNFKIISLN